MGIRKTVALMISTLYGEYFYGVVKGARMAADEKKINLMIIPGGVLGKDRADNVLYHLATQEYHRGGIPVFHRLLQQGVRE